MAGANGMEAYILKAQEILFMHEHVMAETDDSLNAGIKYEDRFFSLLQRPKTKLFGVEQFPSVFEKACDYLHSISNDHIFINGNKRTAAFVFLTYLDLHGMSLSMTNKDFEDYVVEITIRHQYKGNDAIKHITEDLRIFITA